uniref:Cadherin domain-containing protein n=1 Tax=Heterorhabditis bacteriophora TaxID=37862 RepID=A0A1I7XQV5_HETBA
MEPRYSILVNAFDHGVPKRTDITELRIIVHGTNPSAPVFDQKRYEVTLSSPVRAGSVVAELHAKDPDPGLEGQVSYRFAETNDQKTQTDISKFLINDQVSCGLSIAGYVVFLCYFNESIYLVFFYIKYEQASAFTTSSSTVHFRVLEDSSQFVMDGDLLRVATHLIPGYTHLTVRAETDSTHVDHQLRVVVMDGRDKYPVFPQLTYDIDIPIESRFPLTVHRFDARLINGTLRYQFFPEGDTPVGVHLDEISGDLTITSDYLRMSANHDTQFIVVRANNIEYPKFYSDVGVALSIVSNKASMRFPQSLYRIEAMENIPIGSIFGPTIEVFPKVSDSLVRYSIVPDSIIGIHSNGSLFVKEDIDLEQLPVDTSGNLNFVVSIIVTADTGVDRVSTKLQIKIKDANEFPPKFDSKEYLATIVENSIPGSKIVRVRASDGDLTEGEHLLYKITGGSGRNLVFIQEDGTIILGEKPLDHETMSNFNVEVEAIDRTGNTDRTMVRISVQDVNDNTPVFINQTMTWTVPEGSTSESLLIAAEDLDAGDNGVIQFYIVEGNTDGYFEIVPEGHNTASLKLTQPLDREEHPTYNLTVEARDQGTPQHFATTTIIVNVSDVNDNGPIFKQLEYKQKAPSNLPIGFPILTIAAFDADGDRIAYSLKGPGCQSLAIDPLGVISFVVSTSQRSLGVIKCVIEASDGSHSSKATVIIDVFSSIQPTITSAPNHAPEFSKEIYSINVTLDKTDRLLKKVEAKDPDGDIIFYSIEPPEYRNLFEVDAEGIVSLRVPVSYLTQALYSFLVVAEDRKTPIMSTFTNIKVHIPENKRSILTSTSIDPLPTKISTMEVVGSSSESGPSTLPTISISNSRTESLPERINLERASSDGILSRLETRIDADEGNSNNPSSLIITSTQGTFDMMQSSELSTSTPTLFRRLKYMYSIRVDAPVGSYLGQVELLNIEGAELSFENSTRFSIDEYGRVRTNVLFTKVGKIEDVIVAKQQDKVLAKVPFVVHIIGGMTSASTMSTVPPSITTTLNAPLTENVIPTVNSTGFSFLRPVYFAFMPEGNYTNGVKVAIKPEPLSTNTQGRILYSIAGKEQNLPFYLTDDGQLIVFSVDREKTSNYLLNITATAMDMPLGTAYALINVTVLDVNDNYPVFENHPPVLGILRNSPPGKPLYQFTATDADADNYGQVAYEVEGTGGNFVIEPNDGTLSVSQILDDVPDEVMITVIARDNGRPALKAEQQVSIRLFDPLFNAPRLPKEVPEQVVRPHAIPNTEIAQFLAGPNINTQPGQEKILYGLANNYSGLFEIEDDGRLILARRPMENEENRYHQLNVTAENSHGKDWIINYLQINIFVEGTPLTTTPKSSRNNIRCLFPTRIYNAEVMENLEKRIKLIKVTSNCESEGRAYIYTLATESDDFELDSKTGELFAIHSLDREKRSLHFIYINVTSNIVPDTSTRVLRQSNPVIEHAKAKLVASQTLVIVRVLDENDNRPSFIHTTQDGELTATVEWQAPLLTPILRMQIHKLSPDANIIQLTSEMPHSDVHEYMVERTLNEIFESESKVLVKQPFVDHEGHADPTRTHLFVYALDRKTKEPYSGNELVEILKAHSEELRTSPPRISSVALLSSQSTSLSGTDLLLTIICIVLLILLVITCCVLSRYYKRKRSISTTEREYMVNTIRAGPRPYDVEVVSRQTAQAVLAARPIPEPMHSQIEVAVSPIFMDGTVSTNRSDTTRDFANSVRERPSLLQSALARHRVHVSTPLSISSVVEHDKI